MKLEYIDHMLPFQFINTEYSLFFSRHIGAGSSGGSTQPGFCPSGTAI